MQSNRVGRYGFDKKQDINLGGKQASSSWVITKQQIISRWESQCKLHKKGIHPVRDFLLMKRKRDYINS